MGVHFSVMAKGGGGLQFLPFVFSSQSKVTFNLNQELLFKLFNNTQRTPKTLKGETLNCVSMNGAIVAAILDGLQNSA